MIYARRCFGLKMPGQTVAPLFNLTPSRQPLNRRQSTSASFSSEILSAFGDKKNAVLDLTFGDGHHSRLLLGIDFLTYRLAKDSHTLYYWDIDGNRIFISSHYFEARAESFWNIFSPMLLTPVRSPEITIYWPLILMCPCLIDFIGGNGLRGWVGGRGPWTLLCP